MPNPTVSQIRALNTNNELVLHDIVDQGARDLIAELGSPTHYIGVLSPSDTHYADFEDGCEYNPVLIKDGASTKSVTAKSGDILNKLDQEFIFDGTAWNAFGDLSALGAFAYADTGSVSIQPKGTNASSSVSFAAHTKDKVLGEATTFELSGAPTFTPDLTKDSVLGAETTFTNGSSSVTFGTPSTETFLKSTVTATVPKPAASTAKYMELTTQKLVTASAATVTAAGSAGTAASFSAAVDANGVLGFSFTPNTPTALPTFGTQTVATGAVSSNGEGASVGTGITSQSSTATGRVKYIDGITTSGTNSVTFASGHTAAAITELPTATAAAQTITVGTNDLVDAVTDVDATISKPNITVGTNDKVNAITALGAATAAAQTFTGTTETYSVSPVPKS